MGKKRKIRIDLRPNRSKPPRERGWTREYHSVEEADDLAAPRGERIRAKGEISRKRTIIADSGEEGGAAEMPAVDAEECVSGRVLRVQGLHCLAAADDGKRYQCVIRRVLRNLVIDERNIVAAGDRVWLQPAGGDSAVIERVEPRYGVLRRDSRGKEHVIVANVDQVVIVGSLAEPTLKPHLIDRYLVSAAQGSIQPIVCLNKADLIDPYDYQVMIGLFSQLDIPVILASAVDRRGIDRIRELLVGRQTVFAGQSGVGKSSLLNLIQPGLDLEVSEVSDTTQKGRHTTTTAELIPLDRGGWVVDTPGIRQFSIWELVPVELDGFFPEFRPAVARCRFPGCSHTHEANCAVKEGVRKHRIAIQRYESYLGMLAGNEE